MLAGSMAPHVVGTLVTAGVACGGHRASFSLDGPGSERHPVSCLSAAPGQFPPVVHPRHQRVGEVLDFLRPPLLGQVSEEAAAPAPVVACLVGGDPEQPRAQRAGPLRHSLAGAPRHEEGLRQHFRRHRPVPGEPEGVVVDHRRVPVEEPRDGVPITVPNPLPYPVRPVPSVSFCAPCPPGRPSRLPCLSPVLHTVGLPAADAGFLWAESRGGRQGGREWPSGRQPDCAGTCFMWSTIVRTTMALVYTTVPGFVGMPETALTWTVCSPRKTEVFLSKIHSVR